MDETSIDPVLLHTRAERLNEFNTLVAGLPLQDAENLIAMYGYDTASKNSASAQTTSENAIQAECRRLGTINRFLRVKTQSEARTP